MTEMTKKSLLPAVALVVALVPPGRATAHDWPQWKGPERDNRSRETGLLKEWPEGGPKRLWVSPVDLGKGYSTVAIADGTIYTTGLVGDEEYLFALDMDGELKWKQSYGRGYTRSYESSRSTPTVDGDRVYVISGNCSVACFTTDGKPDWTVDAMERFDGRNITWGIAESPLIVGDKVICTPGGKNAGMAALDKKTGETAWVTRELSDKSAYCSPRSIERGDRQLIVTAMSDHVVGVDAETGKLLWKHPYRNGVRAHPNTPLYSDGMLYFTSGYDYKGVMLELNEDGTAVRQVWEDKTLDTHHGGVVRVDGCIYGASWRGNSNGNWVCLEWATGEPLWEQRWINKGSITYADGMLYCYEERRGTLGLVQASPEGFELVSSFRIDEGSGKHWAHPVVSDGRLYIRHGEALTCFDIRGEDFDPADDDAEEAAAREEAEPTRAQEDEIADAAAGAAEGRAQAKLGLARSYLKMHMEAKAAETLNAILAEYPDTKAAAEASEKLAELE